MLRDGETSSTASAEIITLRAIALKHVRAGLSDAEFGFAEIITLRAIALKLRSSRIHEARPAKGRDHNATSYSTETIGAAYWAAVGPEAEIITLRAIALKLCFANDRKKTPAGQRS